MNQNYIDTHAHIFPPYFSDIDSIVKKCQNAGVKKLINIGTNVSESEQVLKIDKKYSNYLYSAVGIHPEECSKLNTDELKIEIDKLKLLIKSQRKFIIALGEIGLDYNFNPSDEDIYKQKLLLEYQLEIGHLNNLPLIIHCRKALHDLIPIIRIEKNKHPELKGVMHSVDGKLEDVLEMIKLGFYVSFNGIVTFKNAQNINFLLENIDINKILVETDSPFLTPTPLRGQQNFPYNIKYIYEYIANKKGITIEDLELEVEKNVNYIFNI